MSEYPDCDTCGCSMNYMPWHYSRGIQRHLHACNKCWPKVNPSAAVPESLKEVVKIQCSDGNWNFDPYMHGMANGMILAQSCITNERPEFLTAPETWLIDAPVAKAEIEQLRVVNLPPCQYHDHNHDDCEKYSGNLVCDIDLLHPDSQAWLLRQKAEAVEKSATCLPGRDFTEIRRVLYNEAQRLRHQADETESKS